jgi:hypothetical protein
LLCNCGPVKFLKLFGRVPVEIEYRPAPLPR